MAAISDLSESEQRVMAAVVSGELVDLRSSDLGVDDLARAAEGGPERTVRAEVLARLLWGNLTRGGRRHRAIRICGARITGLLDLEAASLVCPLYLNACFFDEPIMLNEASAISIRMPGCHMPGLSAAQLTTRGDMVLDSGFKADGGIRLDGAKIGRQLILDSADLANPDGKALSASWITVGQSMLCRSGFIARGSVDLEGAHIGGILSMNGGSFINPADIAINAQRLTVDGAMYCRSGFRVQGELRLFGARIGGQFNLDEATLDCPGGRALFANQLKVENSMFCRHGFTAKGEVLMEGARIGGRFDLKAARLINPGGRALSADRLTVGQSMYCRAGFISQGEIGLVDAQISGRLDFSGAELINEDGYVLDAGGLTVAHDATFMEGFTAVGELHLLDARIGGRLDFEGASFAKSAGRVLNLEGVVASVLFLLPRKRPDGLIDLTNAKIGSFYDDPRTWPPFLRLRGFSYDVLENRTATVRDRLGWLGRHGSGYSPEIYEQLAAAYRRTGRLEDARQVAIAKQRQRRHELNWLARAWNWLLYLTVGYGYWTWLAGIWLAALVAAGSAVFDSAYPSHIHSAAAVVPAFNPFVYSLDAVLPIVDLGEQKAWIAQGIALTVEWLLICAGWVLTTAVVAGVTSALNRHE